MAGSLDGIKVVDLSRVLGGPYCTQMLADHGAEVIKVEPPLGDETRSWGPPFNDELSAYFSGANRNKRSIAIDLQQPEGRDLILRFLQDADDWGASNGSNDRDTFENWVRLLECTRGAWM